MDSPSWRADGTRQLIFMFSGQGSHYYQMGRELFEQVPLFRRHLLGLNSMARDICHTDIVGTMYDDTRKKSHPFDDVRITHPAIFMVEYALAETLKSHGVEPDGVLGVSMGNFAAGTVARSMSAEQALTALQRQAMALHEHAPPGAMLALLGEPALLQAHPQLAEHAELAGVNTPSSFVLSMAEEHRAAVERYLRAHKINFQRMAVTRAFHSSLIDAAAPAAQDALVLARPAMPWFCSTRAGLIENPDAAHLWEAVREPVRMLPTMAAIEAHGRYDYLDLSPSGTLSVVLKYLLGPGSQARHQTVMSPFGSDLARFRVVTRGQI